MELILWLVLIVIIYLGYEIFVVRKDKALENMKYGKELTESDRMRLKEMEKDEELQEVVSYMLLYNVKLEQECVVI